MATASPPRSTTSREERERVVIRFAGDSGDGMQVTGSQFTLETALAGNSLATFPDFPAEIRAPTGTTYGVSAFQINFGSRIVKTAGDQPDVLVALNPAALMVNYKGLRKGGLVILDSGAFKGESAIELLRAQTEETLKKYVELARGMGIPATGQMAIGTDAVHEAQRICLDLARELPRTTFFAGKVIFQRERWYQRLLHNETAFAIQKRLQWAGQTMVIIPARVT